MKTITLCADDYAQNESISKGIIDLISKGRLSAVSCMTNLPDWLSHAEWLKPYQDQVDVGLHFNLTHGKPLTHMPTLVPNTQFPSLSTLLCKTYCKRLSTTIIAAELNAQIDRFVEAMGQLPQFIDGHQHIHQLPAVRQALIEVYHQRYPKKEAYVRVPSNGLAFNVTNIKPLIITLLGAQALKQLLTTDHIPHNTSFAGIYNFKQPAHYATTFHTFLKQVEHKGLIMSHPGLASNDKTDPIAEGRYNEYQYFSSDTFLQDCKQHDILISPFVSAS